MAGIGDAVQRKYVTDAMDQLTQPQQQFSFYRQKPDGDIDPAGEAGWYLQRERERLQMTLDQAGEACGIHPHHLEGIEHGDLTRLPPRTEALRMIGTYAQFLKFDPQPLILHYTQFLPQPVPVAKTGKPRRPHPLSSAKIIQFANIEKLRSYSSGAGGIVASILAAVIVFQGMLFVFSPSEPGEAVIERQAAVETTNAKSEDVAMPQADGQIVASISKVTETALDDAQGGQATRIADEADQSAGGLSGLGEFIEQDVATFKVPLPRVKPTELGQTEEVSDVAVEAVAEPVTPAAASAKVHGAENAGSRLVLKAKAAVWIRIEDRQGNVIMTQTLNKGDTYKVPARDGLIVIARDGGLISYSIDGVDKGPLGDHGEILVGRSLDLQSLAQKG